MTGFNYPVFIYVPEHLEPGKRYPLVVVLPDAGEEAKEAIERWSGTAKRMSFIVLTPTYQRLEDLPEKYDRWFFEVKSLAASMYPVNPQKIFLVGGEAGADYAIYAGINYPEEFSGVAALEGTMGGPFSKILNYQESRDKQVPIFVAMREAEARDDEVEARALRLQEKGYLIEVETYGEETDFSKRDFQIELIRWLDEKSQHWDRLMQEEDKTLGDKIRRGVREFFTV